MSRRRSDESFAGFAMAQRGRLIDAAGLLGARPDQAEDLVEWALADSYPGWGAAVRPDLEVVRRVLISEPGAVSLPWRGRTGPGVVDRSAATTAAPAALRRLTQRQRVILVGRDFLGLTAADLGWVIGIDPDTLAGEYAEAIGRFGSVDVGSRLAAAADGHATSSASDDLAHGRWLQRRQRSRLVLAVAAVVAVLAVLGWQLRPAPAPVSAPPPDPVSTPAPSASGGSALSPSSGPTRCPTSETRCQVQATRAWRAQTATIVATALDPDGRYFTGAYSYGDDDRYDGTGYWAGRDGALGFDLQAGSDGATHVFVQISTSRPAGVRCGALTGHRCERVKFLDGNWFSLSESVDAIRGTEVQYRPYGDQVITLVAMDSGAGKRFDVDRADLVDLIQDARLRLPAR